MAPQTRGKTHAQASDRKGKMGKRRGKLPTRKLPWIHTPSDWAEIKRPGRKTIGKAPNPKGTSHTRDGDDAASRDVVASAPAAARKLTARQRRIAQKKTEKVAEKAAQEMLEEFVESAKRAVGQMASGETVGSSRETTPEKSVPSTQVGHSASQSPDSSKLDLE